MNDGSRAPLCAFAVGGRVDVRRRGAMDYESAWREMRVYTLGRDASRPDEIWLTEHAPVYTVGVAGRPEHLPRASGCIPVQHVDRGGQITYHGPGQAIIYLLLDLRRRRLGVRALVRIMERAVIDWLGGHGIVAEGRVEAPGVYVGDAKIAALGLRVARGCCYHGLAVNIDMDLAPFRCIDPCGYPGLRITQARELGMTESVPAAGDAIAANLVRLLA